MADEAVVTLLQEIRDLQRQQVENSKLTLANQQEALANQQQSIANQQQSIERQKQLMGRSKATWIVLLLFIGGAVFLSVFFPLLSMLLRFTRQN
jgi:hypothetical protein